MDAIALSTELEAVNEMLNAIGEGQVSSLDTGNADVQQAVRLLRDHSRKLQKRGWWFNTNYSQVLTPSTPDGFLTLPSNVLKVDPVETDRWEQPWVQRGLRLFDPEANTYVFTKTVKVDMVIGLDWTELPQSARDYITAAAGLEFVDIEQANENRHAFTQQRVKNAQLELEREDAEAMDLNMFRDSEAGMEMYSRRI